MKKIVPFKKEIMFKTNISEITSISLEHNLHIENNNLITGKFMISGEYKIADTSINTEVFNFDVPFDINVDEKYILDDVIVDIDDFYYEIVNNRSLEVNIDVLIDKLVEKPLIEDNVEDNVDEVSNILESDNLLEEENKIMERCIEKEDILEQLEEFDDDFESLNNMELMVNNKKEDSINSQVNISQKKEIKSMEKINSLFDNLDSNSETYKTYKVFIIRSGDTIESILQKYNISKEELEKYNILSDVKIGDKLIIPDINNEKI